MRFLVYGAGAIGQGLGAMLACAGHQVDLVLRPRFIEAINKHGLRVSGIFGEYRTAPPLLGLLAKAADAAGDYDYILLTVKGYDTVASVADLTLVAARSDCHVVSLQNGCGNVEILERTFGPDRTIGGRVITGFEITEPGQVKITVSADAIHLGSAVSGSIPPAVTALAAAINTAGHPCQAVEDIHKSLYAKLLYNCALNPLGAVLGVNYGPLAENDATRAIINRIIAETFAVIRAIGGTTPWPDAEAYQRTFYETLIPATANHRPSMLQDLENNKPTEVDSLVGYVSMKGKETNIATPTCDTLAGLVKFKENQGRNGAAGSSSASPASSTQST